MPAVSAAFARVELTTSAAPGPELEMTLPGDLETAFYERVLRGLEFLVDSEDIAWTEAVSWREVLSTDDFQRAAHVAVNARLAQSLAATSVLVLRMATGEPSDLAESFIVRLTDLVCNHPASTTVLLSVRTIPFDPSDRLLGHVASGKLVVVTDGGSVHVGRRSDRLGIDTDRVRAETLRLYPEPVDLLRQRMVHRRGVFDHPYGTNYGLVRDSYDLTQCTDDVAVALAGWIRTRFRPPSLQIVPLGAPDWLHRAIGLLGGLLGEFRLDADEEPPSPAASLTITPIVDPRVHNSDLERAVTQTGDGDHAVLAILSTEGEVADRGTTTTRAGSPVNYLVRVRQRLLDTVADGTLIDRLRSERMETRRGLDSDTFWDLVVEYGVIPERLAEVPEHRAVGDGGDLAEMTGTRQRLLVPNFARMLLAERGVVTERILDLLSQQGGTRTPSEEPTLCVTPEGDLASSVLARAVIDDGLRLGETFAPEAVEIPKAAVADWRAGLHGMNRPGNGDCSSL